MITHMRWPIGRSALCASPQFILDVTDVRKTMPYAIDAFFAPEYGVHAEEALKWYGEFLSEYVSATEKRYPLLVFNKQDWYSPFQMRRGAPHAPPPSPPSTPPGQPLRPPAPPLVPAPPPHPLPPMFGLFLRGTAGLVDWLEGKTTDGDLPGGLPATQVQPFGGGGLIGGQPAAQVQPFGGG